MPSFAETAGDIAFACHADGCGHARGLHRDGEGECHVADCTCKLFDHDPDGCETCAEADDA